MKTERMLGFTLLGAGMILIIIAIIGVYNVFTGSANPPEMFEIKNIAISIPAGSGISIQPIELLSQETASKFVDMTVWYILMLFILSAGAKIAGVGVQLLREIKIVIKAKEGENSFSV
jgi:hypothetical protein